MIPSLNAEPKEAYGYRYKDLQQRELRM